MRRHNILQGRKHKAGDVTRTETKEVKAVWLIREEESLVWNNHTGRICLGRAFRFDMLPYTWVQRLEAWFHLKWPQIWTKPGRYRCCTWHQCIFFFFSRLKSGRRGTLMELSADPTVRSLLHLIFSPSDRCPASHLQHSAGTTAVCYLMDWRTHNQQAATPTTRQPRIQGEILWNTSCGRGTNSWKLLLLTVTVCIVSTGLRHEKTLEGRKKKTLNRLYLCDCGDKVFSSITHNPPHVGRESLPREQIVLASTSAAVVSCLAETGLEYLTIFMKAFVASITRGCSPVTVTQHKY